MTEKLDEYRLYVDSRKLKNQSSHSLHIQLDRPFLNCKDIRLANISLCYSFFNIQSNNENILVKVYAVQPRLWHYIYVKEGLYTLDKLITVINNASQRQSITSNGYLFKLTAKSDTRSNKVNIRVNSAINFRVMFDEPIAKILFGSKKDLYNQTHTNVYGELQLQPFSHFYIYCSLIEINRNFEAFDNNIYPSNLIALLPLKGIKEYGTQLTYNTSECDFKPCISTFNDFSIQIKDQDNNFIDLHDCPVIYEFIIRCKK